MIRPLTAALLAFFAAFAPAQAETEEEQRLAVAHELIGVIGGADMYRQLFDVTIAQMWPGIEARSPGVSKEDLRIYREEFAAALQGEVEAMIDETAKIYMRHLTIEEMQASIGFYQSPAGQTLLKKLPIIMGEAMELGTRLGGAIGENAVSKAKARMTERGVEL